MIETKLFELTGTSPASAITALGSVARGLDAYDDFTIDARLTGATGGTLDVYLQRKVADDVWVDWLHFAQVSAAAAAASFSTCTSGRTALSTGQVLAVAQGTDSSAGTPALTAGAFVGGHPGQAVRVVFVAGASTSAGAAQTVRITARKTSG